MSNNPHARGFLSLPMQYLALIHVHESESWPSLLAHSIYPRSGIHCTANRALWGMLPNLQALIHDVKIAKIYGD